MSKNKIKSFRKLIYNWLLKQEGKTDISDERKESIQWAADDCYYSVINDYVPASPGYAGYIVTVVFNDALSVRNFVVNEEGELEYLFEHENKY